MSYLLANRKAVIGECGPQTEIDADIREAIAPAPYDHLSTSVFELLRDDNGRVALARRGHDIFARRHLPDILARAIAETEATYREAAPATPDLGTPAVSGWIARRSAGAEQVATRK